MKKQLFKITMIYLNMSRGYLDISLIFRYNIVNELRWRNGRRIVLRWRRSKIHEGSNPSLSIMNDYEGIYFPPSAEMPKSDDPRFTFIKTAGGGWRKVTVERAAIINSIPPFEELLTPITEAEIKAAK